MNDQEVMGSILRVMHEKRHNDLVPLTMTLGALGVPQNMLRSGLRRMQEKGLIEWLDREVGGLGMGRITNHGIDVAEDRVPPPMPMIIQHVNVRDSSHVQIGQGHTQGISVHLDIGKLVAAIDGSQASADEKAEAKSLLKKVFDNPLVKGVLEKWIKGMTGAG
jgi:hypothetical protein